MLKDGKVVPEFPKESCGGDAIGLDDEQRGDKLSDGDSPGDSVSPGLGVSLCRGEVMWEGGVWGVSECGVESKRGRGERGDRTLPETHH